MLDLISQTIEKFKTLLTTSKTFHEGDGLADGGQRKDDTWQCVLIVGSRHYVHVLQPHAGEDFHAGFLE